MSSNLNDIFFSPVENNSLTYEKILEDVQRYFSENHASTIAGSGDGNSERASAVLKELMAQYLVKRKYAVQGLTTEELCAKLYEDMAGSMPTMILKSSWAADAASRFRTSSHPPSMPST